MTSAGGIIAIIGLIAGLVGLVGLFAFLAAGKRADEFHDRLMDRIQHDMRLADVLNSDSRGG